MKSAPLVFAATLAAAGFIHSQDQSAPVVTAACILGDIPDGTPPPAATPQPEFVVPAKDILQTTTHHQGGRTITLRQIKPIALPPPPAPPATVELDPEFAARLADSREVHPSSGLLFLSAAVYRSADSPPRTLVHYWPEDGGETITFWSSADFALVSGIHSFADTAGQTHSIIMGWGDVDIPPANNLAETDAPEIPTFPEGNATFQFSGKQPAAADLTTIQSLHDLYNSEHPRLLTAYQGREQARLQQEAELKAHPPKPKDITLHFWRTERPAAAKGGAK